ncbi:MAG: twin-arginine translocase TatA/TatE family subunit [Microbacterium sp.]
MLQNLTGWHALLILAVIVLIFGAAKLPGLARSVGQSMRILKDEVRTDAAQSAAAASAPTAASEQTTVAEASAPVTALVPPAPPTTAVPLVARERVSS